MIDERMHTSSSGVRICLMESMHPKFWSVIGKGMPFLCQLQKTKF